MYMYNLLIFFYLKNSKKLTKEFSELIKKNFQIYIEHRNGAAHLDIKTMKDAKIARDSVFEAINDYLDKIYPT